MRFFSRPHDPKGRIIVSARNDIVYIRVPKCANSSITKALEDGKEEKIDLARLRKLYPGSKVFSFVRNPWARLVSGYREKMSLPEFAWKNAAKRLVEIDARFRPGMPFEKFVELICALPDEEVEKHFRSQSYFLKHNSELVPDFVGRLERIEQDWQALQQFIGTPLPLQHVNRSEETDYRHYFSNTQLRYDVADRYAEDIATFGYEFD